MTGSLTAGLAGVSGHGCVALASERELAAVCEQQRVTRIRGAGFNSSGVPDEALDVLLGGLGSTRADVTRYAAAEATRPTIDGRAVERIDHHLAHACTAYLSSPVTSATIVVCDHEAPKVSVWSGSGASVTSLDWPWEGIGFADLYSAIAPVFGFDGPGGPQRFEALARLQPDRRDSRVDGLFNGDGHSLNVPDGWRGSVEGWLRGGGSDPGQAMNAGLASALQVRIGELFLDFLAKVRARTGSTALCLAGSLFYHSSLNTLAKRSGLFSTVFVPIDPGNPGLAVGSALHAMGSEPQRLSPFLGPRYDATEIKSTLDNCKLRYTWERDEAVIGTAVQALERGALVGWFEGRMEWGPRALGARSILASPFSPYVLENLNRFLKRREPWRGYAVSALKASMPDLFDGCDDAPYMEADGRPRDARRFGHLLPGPNAAIRVQSVDAQSPPRFRRLLEAFGAATGIPCLVNTSFNGFHEPIVCNPRDAVRVFYGSGVDVLVLDQFLLSK